MNKHRYQHYINMIKDNNVDKLLETKEKAINVFVKKKTKRLNEIQDINFEIKTHKFDILIISKINKFKKDVEKRGLGFEIEIQPINELVDDAKIFCYGLSNGEIIEKLIINEYGGANV